MAAQLGHLVEHLIQAFGGRPLIGPAADSELSHLLFNSLIALLALAVLRLRLTRVWAYALAIIAVLHAAEHTYIYEQFLRTGIVAGPGLLGQGGALQFIPLPRVELHNAYNGLEMVLITLGFWDETDRAFSIEGD